MFNCCRLLSRTPVCAGNSEYVQEPSSLYNPLTIIFIKPIFFLIHLKLILSSTGRPLPKKLHIWIKKKSYPLECVNVAPLLWHLNQIFPSCVHDLSQILSEDLFWFCRMNTILLFTAMFFKLLSIFGWIPILFYTIINQDV